MLKKYPVVIVRTSWCFIPHSRNYQVMGYEIPLIMLEEGWAPQQVPQSVADRHMPRCWYAGLHMRFMYSKDLFDTSSPHFAFFSFPDAMGIVEGNGFLCYDNTSKKVVAAENGSVTVLLSKTQAYLQKLYDGLGQLGIGHGNPDVIKKKKK